MSKWGFFTSYPGLWTKWAYYKPNFVKTKKVWECGSLRRPDRDYTGEEMYVYATGMTKKEAYEAWKQKCEEYYD